jgi:hypothetical protein
VSWFRLADQVKWPAGASRANENIPTPHHRLGTAPAKQSTGSTFDTSFLSGVVQIVGQG